MTTACCKPDAVAIIHCVCMRTRRHAALDIGAARAQAVVLLAAVALVGVAAVARAVLAGLADVLLIWVAH